MTILNYFHDQNHNDVELSHANGQTTFKTTLSENSHAYIYSKRIMLDDLNELSGLNHMCAVLYSDTPSLSLAVIYYAKDGSKLSGEIIPCNQSQKILIPEQAITIAFGIRFYGRAEGVIHELICGSERFINEVVSKHGSFDGLMAIDQPAVVDDVVHNLEKPLIIMETVFCDTENDPLILERYQTFFSGLFVSIVNQEYRNYLWCIFVSKDKSVQIDVFTKWIAASGLESKIKLIPYMHPKEGYGHEDDDHIDRARRPNTSLENRRQALTQMIESQTDIDFESFQYIVRMGLDDDDFISSRYLEDVSNCVLDSYLKIPHKEKHRVFGFPNICCAYYRYDGSVDLDKVSMSRAMTGAKFSAAKFSLPMSPFAISEDFLQWTRMNNQNVTYHKIQDNLPGFFYNRHGQNFSNQSKKFFYDRQFEAIQYRSQSEFYKEEIMSSKVNLPEVYETVSTRDFDVSLLLLSSKRSSHHAFVEGLLKSRRSYYDNDCLINNGDYRATKTVEEVGDASETSVYALSLERDFSLETILKDHRINTKLNQHSSDIKKVLYLRDPLNTAASTFNIYDKVTDNPSFNFKFVQNNINHYLGLVESYLSMDDKSDLVFIYSNHFWSDSVYQQKKLEEMGLPEAKYSTKMSYYGGGGNSFFGNKKEVTSNDLVTRYKKYIDNEEFMGLIDNQRFYSISEELLSFVKDEYLLDQLNSTLANQYSMCS